MPDVHDPKKSRILTTTVNLNSKGFESRKDIIIKDSEQSENSL